MERRWHSGLGVAAGEMERIGFGRNQEVKSAGLGDRLGVGMREGKS